MKITPLLAGAMSGSLNGVTASHNRGGAYLRARTVPTDPNTTRQATQRAALAGAVNSWYMELTHAQRLAWEVYASNVPMTDTLGQTFHLTGQQAYTKTATLQTLINLGAPNTILNAPTTFNTGEPINLITDDSAIDQVLVWDPPEITGRFSFSAPASGSGIIALFWGIPQNRSVNFYRGPYQFALYDAFSTNNTFQAFSTDTTDSNAWRANAAPAVGQWVPLRARALYSDGRVSAAYHQFVELVAPP